MCSRLARGWQKAAATSACCSPVAPARPAPASLLELRDSLTHSDVLRMLNVIAELEPRFKRSTQQRLLLETLLVRFALMDRSISLEEILRGFGPGGGGPSEPGGPTGGGG